MENAKYVDGFVLVVSKDKVEEYKKMAKDGAKMWKKFGALDYKECMGDDLYPKPPEGMPPEMESPRSFVEVAGAMQDETVWFSFITYKSRAHRDQVNKKVMAEMGKQAEKYKDMVMPFDMKRMAVGGFKVIIN